MEINIKRIISDLEILNTFNSTPQNGCSRYSFSIEDTRAKEYLAGEMEAIGMEVWFDGIGNLHGLLKGIVGLKWFKIMIKGESNHAGATPMKYRLDPVVEGCKLISEIPNIVKSIGDNSIVATVGKISIFPNQTNIIAKFMKFTIDLRGINEKNLLTVIDIIENTIKTRKYSYMKLYSGANHDTSILGKHIPTAMIFVPSIVGRSHCKEELTKEKDIEAGCQILCDTIFELLKK